MKYEFKNKRLNDKYAHCCIGDIGYLKDLYRFMYADIDEHLANGNKLAASIESKRYGAKIAAYKKQIYQSARLMKLITFQDKYEIDMTATTANNLLRFIGQKSFSQDILNFYFGTKDRTADDKTEFNVREYANATEQGERRIETLKNETSCLLNELQISMNRLVTEIKRKRRNKLKQRKKSKKKAQ